MHGLHARTSTLLPESTSAATRRSDVPRHGIVTFAKVGRRHVVGLLEASRNGVGVRPLALPRNADLNPSTLVWPVLDNHLRGVPDLEPRQLPGRGLRVFFFGTVGSRFSQVLGDVGVLLHKHFQHSVHCGVVWLEGHAGDACNVLLAGRSQAHVDGVGVLLWVSLRDSARNPIAILPCSLHLHGVANLVGVEQRPQPPQVTRRDVGVVLLPGRSPGDEDVEGARLLAPARDAAVDPGSVQWTSTQVKDLGFVADLEHGKWTSLLLLLLLSNPRCWRGLPF
mmetsp:Transcript_61965/g.191889  ORF Transcript_61965/g.191889 Transcript_61965/m.191889 type:complete len:280 (+) Transcript_61965:27-866(+)